MTDATIDDYSGPFIPDIQLENLSRDALLRLIKCYQDSYRILNEAWTRVVSERFGAQDTTDAVVEMWLIAGPQVAEATCKAMKFDHRGVEGYMKRRQLDVGMFLKDIVADWRIKSPTEGKMIIPEQLHYKGPPTDEMIAVVRNFEISTAQICGFFADPNLIFYPNKMPLMTPGDIGFDIDVKVVPQEENPYPYYSGRNIKSGDVGMIGLRARHDPAEFERPWSEHQIRELWKVITPPIREILIEMAKRPEGYPEEELAEKLGISVTKATYLLNFVFLALFDSDWPNKRMPFHFVGNPVRYEMDANWAKLLSTAKDLIDAPMAPLPNRG